MHIRLGNVGQKIQGRENWSCSENCSEVGKMPNYENYTLFSRFMD